MWPPRPHTELVIHCTYKWSAYFWAVDGFILGIVIFFNGFDAITCNQKPKYSISAFLKKYFSISYLSLFSFSLSGVDSNLFTWSVQYPSVKINRSSRHALINSNPWNKSYIFCWIFYGELATPIDRRLYWYFPHRIMIIHELLAFFLI